MELQKVKHELKVEEWRKPIYECRIPNPVQNAPAAAVILCLGTVTLKI